MLNLSLGFSHEIKYEIPSDIEVIAEKATRIIIRGIDREKVGQVAAKICYLKRPDPYKVKGIMFEGEKIIRKAHCWQYNE